jgi:hypothetical protein
VFFEHFLQRVAVLLMRQPLCAGSAGRGATFVDVDTWESGDEFCNAPLAKAELSCKVVYAYAEYASFDLECGKTFAALVSEQLSEVATQWVGCSTHEGSVVEDGVRRVLVQFVEPLPWRRAVSTMRLGSGKQYVLLLECMRSTMFKAKWVLHRQGLVVKGASREMRSLFGSIFSVCADPSIEVETVCPDL